MTWAGSTGTQESRNAHSGSRDLAQEEFIGDKEPLLRGSSAGGGLGQTQSCGDMATVPPPPAVFNTSSGFSLPSGGERGNAVPGELQCHPESGLIKPLLTNSHKIHLIYPRAVQVSEETKESSHNQTEDCFS